MKSGALLLYFNETFLHSHNYASAIFVLRQYSKTFVPVLKNSQKNIFLSSSSAIILLFFYFVIIKTLFTLGLERNIYKNEIITAKDKRIIHASCSRTSRLQARLRETSNLKNANAPNRKRRKLAHLLLGI